MKNYYLKIRLTLFAISSLSLTSMSQSTPFNCDFSAYLFQTNDVYALDLASGSSYLVAADITSGNINATGYNPTDGYIWGYLSSPANTIARIGKNFVVDTFYVSQLPGSGNYVGDIDSNGIYYLKGGGTSYHKIDLNPNSTNYTTYISAGTLSQNISIADWAFNATDGKLYTVERASNHLFRIDPVSSLVSDLGEVPVLSGLNYTYGAVYFDSTGHFYVSANQTGTIYKINGVQNITTGGTITSNIFAFGPSSSSNDGARCPTAPVPQEDCVNGIDDDGDGLIDCNDPSCSGVASCPVIVAPVSGGSGGGLESNDRLSQQINNRNYLRSKTNFKFDVAKAPEVIKNTSYKKLNSSRSGLSLRDLIPLGVLEGTSAVESSPLDLINITNATELFSVDYIKEGKPVAVVLATKTENGVYEHSKYICDRLLGAELLSVSTITIRNQSFIKSIIKNVDGTVEFVLSFSGKLSDDSENFEIESHWNIDKYEDSVTFYNFQIWTNEIDDLIKLGEETLELFNVQKPIISFNNSNPPSVFVKKGVYKKGSLELEIVNTNSTNEIYFDAGFKRTETSETEKSSTLISLESTYLNSVIIETGNLFDIGFRLRSNNGDTPDDLFLSDGPWGVDASENGTNIDSYIITENEDYYTGNGLRVARNVELEATTSEYVSIYRSFTPRFVPVNLSGFNTVAFDASGNGEMEITIIKKGISNWENQYRLKVQLAENQKHYEIPYELFTSLNGGKLDLSDAVSIVFTLASDGITKVDKKLKIADLEFLFQEKLFKDESEIILAPNPIDSDARITFFSNTETAYSINVYEANGRLLKSVTGITSLGNNQLNMSMVDLNLGIYFISITTEEKVYKSIKFLKN